MDFCGQQLAERVSTALLTAAAVAAFGAGYAAGEFGVMVRAYAAAVALAAAACVPAWPAYRRHAVAWLPARQQPQPPQPHRHRGGARPVAAGGGEKQL